MSLFNVLIKKTMDSDESYHSESEFYYPNEEDKENNADETQPSFTMSDVQIKLYFGAATRKHSEENKFGPEYMEKKER